MRFWAIVGMAMTLMACGVAARAVRATATVARGAGSGGLGLSAARRHLSGLQIQNMRPAELLEVIKSDSASKYQIIDVREDYELAASALPTKVIHLPLSKVGRWADEILEGAHLDSSKPAVCVCHHGVRSMKVAVFLAGEAGFSQVYNLAGGMDAVSSLDPSVPRY